MATKPMTPDEMRETAAKNSPFLKMEDGESVTVHLEGCVEIPQQRDPSKSTYRYTVINEDGDEKFFESAANGLLNKMADLVGKKIRLTRKGTGTTTRYEVEEVRA